MKAAAWILLASFLALLVAVPVSQTVRELDRGERVQFTEVFRQAPVAADLRRYEETLKEKSWVQQAGRPAMQRLLFRVFGEPGAKAVAGRDGWLFYRPDVRYLVEGDRSDRAGGSSSWVEPGAALTQRQNVVRAIRRFRDQLRERGIELLVVPVPGKPSVYPEQVTSRIGPGGAGFAGPTKDLLADLERDGVATLDLLTVFRQALEQAPAERLYLVRDTHWTPRGAQRAAEAVAERLRALGWSPKPARAFRTEPVTVERWGDILEMMQIPGLREDHGPERIECVQVLDPALGPLVPGASERPGTYRYPAEQATVLVLGDSFMRIYQYPEPRSLGAVVGGAGDASGAAGERQGSKRLLPGSAGFVSHLARALEAPVDAIASDGGAATDVRRKLSVNPEILEGKRVVIWEFVERDIALGQAGWQEVPLPVALGL